MQKDSFEKMLDAITVPHDLRPGPRFAEFVALGAPSLEDLIDQGHLTPTGRRRPSPAVRFGELLHKSFSKPRIVGMPYGRCNNLDHIYGADMYAPTAVQVLRTENATLRRRLKAYTALALLGWAAVVVMGLVL